MGGERLGASYMQNRRLQGLRFLVFPCRHFIDWMKGWQFEQGCQRPFAVGRRTGAKGPKRGCTGWRRPSEARGGGERRSRDESTGDASRWADLWASLGNILLRKEQRRKSHSSGIQAPLNLWHSPENVAGRRVGVGGQRRVEGTKKRTQGRQVPVAVEPLHPQSSKREECCQGWWRRVESGKKERHKSSLGMFLLRLLSMERAPGIKRRHV